MPKKRDHGLGALYEIRGGKLWRGVVDLGMDADGKRDQRYVTARTKSACVRKLEDLKTEIAEHGAPLGKQVTVAAWSQTWLTSVVHDVDPKTYSGYAGVVKNWIVPTVGRKTVAALKPSDVTAVRSAIRKKLNPGTSTARQAHVVLSMMLDAAVAEKLCRTNVAKGAKKPGGKTVTAKKRGSLSTEQAVAILAAAAAMPDSAGSRWWFKLLCGQRQGEILGATLSDLHLDTGYYEVSWKLEELPRVHGCPDDAPCGRKRAADCPAAQWRVPDEFDMEHLTGAWHLTRPKSNEGRAVPLIPQLVEAMRRHVEATKDLPNPHGLIWRNPDGSPILPRDDAQQWRDLLVAAKVITPEESRPGGTTLTGHWTRHTVVTILASLGVDFQLIGEIVGHSSAQVTAMYRHALDAEKVAAMDKLGQVWGVGLVPQIGASSGSPSA